MKGSTLNAVAQEVSRETIRIPRAKVRVTVELDRSDNFLPAELATTDRVCQRWAVSIGMGLPAERWRDEEASRPPPLDDPTAIIVDQIILKSPHRTQRLVRGWYCTTIAQPVLAKQFNLTERTIITAWHLCLNFLQFRFVESGHKPLLALLRLRD
jgi:hypothetical protein